jgi:hypothetical protein
MSEMAILRQPSGCRLGHISKQGNVLLRFLPVEAAQVTVRSQQEWRSKFFHLAMRRGGLAILCIGDMQNAVVPRCHFLSPKAAPEK